MQENKNCIIICLPPPAIAKHEVSGTSLIRGDGAVTGRLFFGMILAAFLCASAQEQAAPAPKQASDSARASSGNRVISKLEALLAHGKYSLQNVGVVVKDLDRDSVIVALNADSLYNPASVSKLLTTAMAFERLGTNYAFETSVYCEEPIAADTGICHGNLYVRGGADPYFVIERMWLFVQHLICIGLKSIEGDVVLDDSFFDSNSVGPGFDEDDSSHPYVAPVDAVSANFNCESIWIRPGRTVGSPVLVDILPKASIVKLVVSAQTTAAGKPFSVAAGTQRDGDKTLVTVSGGMPIDASPVVQYKKVWQTWEYFGNVFEKLLEDNKIKFKGKIRRSVVPDSVKARGPLYVFPSVPLYEAVNSMNKVSNNYMAEMLFKTLSAGTDSAKGSWEKSAALALAWWKEKKLPGVPRIKNGSGMGDSNRMSARQITELLRFVWTQKSFFPEYVYSLPSAGIDGTLKSRFKESRLKGIVRAKTGTLNDYGVSTIAGYAFVQKKTYAFSVMFCNCTNVRLHNNWETQEKILELVIPEK
jgi:PBP4 family serine-type D-alanyl-D-alanine carboxypeptidase